MRTVVVGRHPELDEILERRRRLGQDLYDEVWEGELHVVPGPAGTHAKVQADIQAVLRAAAREHGWTLTGPTNIGTADDYRVPDAVVFAGDVSATFHATALVVIEVLSPDDETYDKLGFYARRGVEEVIVADLATRSVTCWRRRGDGPGGDGPGGDGYEQVEGSEQLDVTAADVVEQIDWP